ncbi:MAG: hypothetical protein R3321_08790, partial [Nitrososphaeraceae archaeon]|nr:hypothetical protein [Nitrososphaeraceae archaeon]
IRDGIDTFLNNSLNPLSSHLIVYSSGKLGHLIRETESKKVITGLSQIKEVISKNIQKIIVDLLFRKSEGLILARKLSSTEDSGSSNIDSILNLVDYVNPSRSTFQQLPLPYYYKKLFSGTSHVSSEFWVGMKNELTQASTALKRYGAGFSGGILIIGERNCGKSTLSRIIALKHFNKNRIYILKAGKEATSNIEIFEESVRNSFGINGSVEEIFQSIPPNSVVIINDLELWWNRSEDGFNVIDMILNLISKYSGRILFIVNCSVQSFRLINQIKRINDLFISIIHCEPFDAEDLKNIIILRHSSSGMKFKLGGSEEDSLSELSKATLFNSYFNYSKGNVGVALNTWLNHIINVDENVITITSPVEPDISMLEKLDIEWLVYLAQIILHRRLSIKSLTKLMMNDEEHNLKVVASLLRAGLIVEKIEKIYGINTFIEPYITKILEKKELL